MSSWEWAARSGQREKVPTAREMPATQRTRRPPPQVQRPPQAANTVQPTKPGHLRTPCAIPCPAPVSTLLLQASPAPCTGSLGRAFGKGPACPTLGLALSRGRVGGGGTPGHAAPAGLPTSHPWPGAKSQFLLAWDSSTSSCPHRSPTTRSMPPKVNDPWRGPVGLQTPQPL